MEISAETERRFILGSQGLWPGRRWKGRIGVRAAINACRRFQVDPLDVVGRSQDIALASRVVGYRPEDLDAVLYRDRDAYEFGGALRIVPRDQLRLDWSWVQNEGLPTRWNRWHDENTAVVRRVLKEIDHVGPCDSLHWVDGVRTENYRSSRVEGVALYYLWRSLQVLIHHREANRKFYDRTERLLGPLPSALSKEETLTEVALETMTWLGLSGREGIPYLRTNEAGRGRSKVTKRQVRQRLLDDGRLSTVKIEGRRELSVLRSDQLPLLEEIADGGVPRLWKPLSEEPEALFLTPLDIIVDRVRAQTIFDFDYLWEVYKPASQRKWGYYVLPVLLGDRLIGRIEPVRDPSKGSLRVLNAWWENGINAKDVAGPVARGLLRMASQQGAKSIGLGHVGPPSFRGSLEAELRRQES